ncbi:hypothetical protein [Antarcticirhabdus aurantiaca]|uniref:Uncharacterized protein n=1 Tax=Antarcticirhabdus aurantiaca TaxID=2606717 RepID=A0ACD4NKE0_9HYPH|nr:hypothetical protein [Antarcticirhabdus aurantiaca]WAJ27277.1 hypothetical protein OXU80_20850 [Jeongeuplla avenae]
MQVIDASAGEPALSAYGDLWYVVATRPSRASKVKFERPFTDLSHNVWYIQTEDPEKVVDAIKEVHFEHVVAEGGSRLCDPRFSRDLVTAKILVVESLRGHYMRPVSADVVLDRLLHFTWNVRWRNALGITRMSYINAALFDQHCELIENEGVQGLVPIADRISRMEAEVRQGTAAWPTYRIHQKTFLDMTAVADELGMPVAMLRRTRPRSLLMAAISRTSAQSPPIAGDNDDGGGNEPGELSAEKLTYTSALRRLHVWKALYELSTFGLLHHDPLGFDPFAEVDMSARARQIGTTDEARTDNIEPEQWLALMDGAARWVLDYGEPLLKIIEESKELNTSILGGTSKGRSRSRVVEFKGRVQHVIDKYWRSSKSTLPPLAPVWRRSNTWMEEDERIPLDLALTLLVTACFILIGGLSARRKSEMRSLQVDCTWQDAFGNWWLSCYILKTLRDIDKIPVPASVAAAVRLMETISAPTRRETGKRWIFKVSRPAKLPGSVNRTNLELDFSESINVFARIIGVPSLPNGTTFHFAIHQLRRAFGIYYYHGNRFGNLDALSRFLRHFDPEMTRKYITGVMQGAFLSMAEAIKARLKSRANALNKAKLPDHATTEKQIDKALRELSQRAQAFEEVRQDAYVTRTLDVFDGAESPIGLGAARLYDDLERMATHARTRITIGGRSNAPPDEVRASLAADLKRVARTRHREPVPGGHAHCAFEPGNSEHIADARCLREKCARLGSISDDSPDYAFATVDNCTTCVHGILFSENQRVLNERTARLAVVAATGSSQEVSRAADLKFKSIKAGVAAARLAVSGKGRLDG